MGEHIPHVKCQFTAYCKSKPSNIESFVLVEILFSAVAPPALFTKVQRQETIWKWLEMWALV